MSKPRYDVSHMRIYQLNSDNFDKAFIGFKRMMEKYGEINMDWYDCVYQEEIQYLDAEDKEEAFPVLEKIFEKFNINRPEDFKGHSLSVGDIVDIDDICFYCDHFGWRAF